MPKPSLVLYVDDEPVVRLDLDLEGFDFILDHLPSSDGFTQQLFRLREEVEASHRPGGNPASEVQEGEKK